VTANKRRCFKCRRRLDEMGRSPDPCLGLLPGVSQACCGHGRDSQAYVVIGGEPNESCFERELISLHGKAACIFFHLIEGNIKRATGTA
jgi:hypothetical protein